MRIRNHRHRLVHACEASILEGRRLLAGSPLLIDFGQSGSPTTYANMGQAYVAGSTITTPAHQVGQLGCNYNVYNNVSTSNRSSLVYGDGTAASGVALRWGRSSTSGGLINFNDASKLAAIGAGSPNSANQEFNNSLYGNVISGTGATAEEAVAISGLPAGAYKVYFSNNYIYGQAGDLFSDQIGVNLTAYDATQAQLQGSFRIDGTFTAPGDFVTQTLTLNAGDSLTVIVHGLYWNSAYWGNANNKFNVLEIVPVELAGGSAAVASPQMGIYTSPAPWGPSNATSWSQWIGHPEVWGEEFESADTWGGISNSAWAYGPWSTWVKAQAGRRLILGVPMLPSNDGTVSLASGATGAYKNYFKTLAQNLVNYGLGNTIIRLGWEFNGGWYKWAANGHQQDFINYWQQIVTTMRSVSGQSFKFDWNPAQGYQQFPAEQAYPGDAYVDYIGLDVYDQSYYSDTYPFSATATDADKQYRREEVAYYLLTQQDGINFWSQFASSHGKPLTIPEWGVHAESSGHGGQDNPLFIQMMDAIFKNPANNVAFQVYFDVAAPDGDHQLWPNADGSYQTEFPNSKAMFQRLFAGPSALPTGWVGLDIGSPSPAGSALYTSGTYTTKGSGSDIYNSSDQFYYTSTTTTGDQIIIARVTGLTNTNSNAKAGVMFRDSTAANAMFAMADVRPSGSIEFLYRTSTGGSAGYSGGVSTGLTPSTATPVWVRLVRSGNTFAAYCATGTSQPASWTQVGSPQTIAFGNASYRAGVAVCSHASGTLATATFDTLSLLPPAPSALSFLVNDGSAQRSMVTSLTLTFDRAVMLASDAVSLTQRGGGSVQLLTSNPSGDSKTYVITFSGTDQALGSLNDGIYDLAVRASSVQDAYGQALSGGDRTCSFVRLFGDYDGNGAVNGTDYYYFKKAFGQSTSDANYLWFMDFDGNGAVNGTDYLYFKKDFGSSLIL